MNEENERLLEHAWRHFSFHAQQRTTVFNFFTASAGLTLSGLFYVLATPTAPKIFGVAAGLSAALLALIFWKLDQRVTQLIKEGENVSIAVEQLLTNQLHRVFSRVEQINVNTSYFPFSGTWSYGRAFRLMFIIVAFTGLLGAGAATRTVLSALEVRPTKVIVGKPAAVKSETATIRSERGGGVTFGKSEQGAKLTAPIAEKSCDEISRRSTTKQPEHYDRPNMPTHTENNVPSSTSQKYKSDKDNSSRQLLNSTPACPS